MLIFLIKILFIIHHLWVIYTSIKSSIQLLKKSDKSSIKELEKIYKGIIKELIFGILLNELLFG